MPSKLDVLLYFNLIPSTMKSWSYEKSSDCLNTVTSVFTTSTFCILHHCLLLRTSPSNIQKLFSGYLLSTFYSIIGKLYMACCKQIANDSLMKVLNSSGTKTLPCGRPTSVVKDVPFVPSIEQIALLFLRNCISSSIVSHRYLDLPFCRQDFFSIYYHVPFLDLWKLLPWLCWHWSHRLFLLAQSKVRKSRWVILSAPFLLRIH